MSIYHQKMRTCWFLKSNLYVLLGLRNMSSWWLLMYKLIVGERLQVLSSLLSEINNVNII